MSALAVLATPELIGLATSLFAHYVNAGHPKSDIPSIEDLKSLIARLVKNGLGGPLDLKSPNAIDSVLEMISFLKQEKSLGGVADFLSKSQFVSLISSCLADVGAERPQVDPNVVNTTTDSGKDYCYLLGEPFPTVQGDVEKAKRLVKQAFQVWRRVANIRFADFTDRPDACDLKIIERAIDANGGTLAVGTVGGGRGDKQIKELVFDSNEGDWQDRGKFFLTACHETGHLLGLVHGGAIEGDLMWPMLEKSISDEVMDQLENTNPLADDVLQQLAMGELKIDGGKTLFSANDIQRAVNIWGEPPPLPVMPDVAAIPKPEDVRVI